jgi:ABC-type dipeptide/oligopeptide/nickel transport system permease subunit
MWTITLIFFVGVLLGYAAGYKSGWNAHVDYKLDETITRATEQAERERR